jgi:glutamate-1-semialdehyde 2,1-aminomutase
MPRIDEAVAVARLRYTEAHQGSRRLAEAAAMVMPGGNTRSVLHFDPFPFRVESVEGPYLLDVDGHRYLDLLGNYSAGLLGHNPIEVRRAVSAAMEAGWTSGAVRAAETEYATLVCERYPSIEMVRFTNSGTEANLMAIATAKHHTGREKVVAFEDAYHGGVLYFGEAGRPLLTPHPWVVTEYNDLDRVEEVFSRQPEKIAGVIVEPMLAASGCIPGSGEFLHGLRRVTADAGSLLIFDEVMTSRLSPSGAQGLLGIEPDLTTLGKYIAGGLSAGAFGGRRDVMSVFDPATDDSVSHGGTFNNNELSVAAGVAVLGEILNEELIESVNARGDHVREGLNTIFERAGLEMVATGLGSLLTIHAIKGPVRSPRDLVEANDALKELLFFDLLEAGYYLARRGFIALSVDITDEHITGFLDEVEEWAKRVAGLVR